MCIDGAVHRGMHSTLNAQKRSDGACWLLDFGDTGTAVIPGRRDEETRAKESGPIVDPST